MSPSPPHDVAEARLTLGCRLADLRKAAGYTQHSLAPLTFYGRSTIANVERGRQSVRRDFWVRCDEMLRTGGSPTAKYDHIRLTGSRLASPATTAAASPASQQVAVYEAPRPDMVSLLKPRRPNAAAAGHLRLWAPRARFFPGLAIHAQMHSAVDDGRVLAAVPDGYGDDPFLHRPARGLVIG